jgi:hypothetical protein
MLLFLIAATILVCVVSAVKAYKMTHDVFHPAILLSGLCAFMYGYMPLSLTKDGLLFVYVTEAQADFCQTLAFLGILAMMIGCFKGSAPKAVPAADHPPAEYSWEVLRRGAYWLGGIGFVCWVITIKGAGGISGAFGHGNGGGTNDIGYIRDAIFLLVVALILLLTPEVMRHRDTNWNIAIVLFSTPWLMQGLLAAKRGPTFVIACTMGMSWYLAHKRRPSLPLLICASGALGALMLFLVTNRDKIYLGSDFSDLKTDITTVVTDANVSNEYIFGTGCIDTARVTGNFWWGRRYIAEILIRPIPRQLWRYKYGDMGLLALRYNAGAGGTDGGGALIAHMGWGSVPGAAAAMIADLWVEFSWLFIPVIFGIGYAYGRVWRRATEEGGPWNSQYTIFSVLAIYMVTQSGEAVIFRFLILTLPTRWIWRKAQYPPVEEHLTEDQLCVS